VKVFSGFFLNAAFGLCRDVARHVETLSGVTGWGRVTVSIELGRTFMHFQVFITTTDSLGGVPRNPEYAHGCMLCLHGLKYKL